MEWKWTHYQRVSSGIWTAPWSIRPTCTSPPGRRSCGSTAAHLATTTSPARSAAAKLATRPAWCVVVEDAVFGVQAAKAGGMGCIAVRGGGHSAWDDLKAAGADLVVESLEDVQVHSFERLVR